METERERLESGLRNLPYEGKLRVLRFFLRNLEWQKTCIENDEGRFADHANPAPVKAAALLECLAQLHAVRTMLASL